nr:thioesterase domain-containing protein [Nocardia sienata]
MPVRRWREIRRVQPRGPYHLLGWSFGGLIAHAVAARLERSGAAVGAVALLDTRSAEIDGESIERLSAGGYVNAFGAAFGIHDVRETATARQAAEAIRERNGGVSIVDAGTLEQMAASFNSSVRNLVGYRPPVFRGDLLYFSATVDTTDARGPSGWRQHVTGAITNYDIEVTHNELTTPHALSIIAQVLDEHLQDWQ